MNRKKKLKLLEAKIELIESLSANPINVAGYATFVAERNQLIEEIEYIEARNERMLKIAENYARKAKPVAKAAGYGVGYLGLVAVVLVIVACVLVYIVLPFLVVLPQPYGAYIFAGTLAVGLLWGIVDSTLKLRDYSNNRGRRGNY